MVRGRMNYDLQDSDLPTVLAEGPLVADETQRLFGRLSGAQVNWKRSEAEWSIGQLTSPRQRRAAPPRRLMPAC
jgi:hypothetical protein